MVEIKHRETRERLHQVNATTLEGVDLSNANLVNADLFRAALIGANLRGAHLEGALLREANLRRARLDDGYLFCADLQGANLQDCTLFCANLQTANLQHANLTNSNLRGANLQGADFSDAIIKDANLAGANLRDADLGGANLASALLDGADLTGANLHCADLRHADLTGAKLQGANLEGADLDDANIRNALYNNKTRWPDGFNPRPYQRLDIGTHFDTQVQGDSSTAVEGLPPMVVREACLTASGKSLQFEDRTHCPTIPGVEILQTKTFINARRTLVVSYNSHEPPGILGYTVVVRPGYNVGDHYHHRREERIIVLHGRVEFVLQDHRPDSAAFEKLNLFTVDEPGVCVRIPVGVAHCVIAQDTIAVLQVLASCDYDHNDDVRVALHQLRSGAFRPMTADAGTLYVGEGRDD